MKKSKIEYKLNILTGKDAEILLCILIASNFSEV